MKIRIPVYVVCILIIASIQSTLVDYIKINNVKPNLLLIFIISIALLRGNIEGGIVGFFAGLVQDILFGKVLGFYALIGLYFGVIIGMLNKRLYRDNYLVVTFFTFTSTIVYELLIYLFNTLLPLALSSGDFSFELLNPLMNVTLTETLYNSLMSIPIYILTMKIDNKIEIAIKNSRKF